jgi:transposase
MVDQWVPVIERWLAEDRGTWHKQRHTATRIWQRLRDEHGATVSYSTVRRKVAELRREFACEREAGFMGLVWHPGEAQADFGQVEVSWRGAPARMHHFVLDFPYSNIGVSQLMPGENAECTCQALKDIFAWLGGVPERIVYDNAAGVGRKRHGGEVRLTDLFERFQAHYGFEYAFCNPYSGHEKGAVEAKVGAVRRSLFVPRPSIWNLVGFNERLLERCLALGGKPHYRKGEDETTLFEADRAALKPLPAKELDVVRYTRMKADKYGVVTIDGRHRYAADPANAGREVIIGFRALEIEILDATGRRIALHPRAYGDAPTSSEDPSRQLELLCNRPNAWANSQVRDVLPDPLREWLDAQERSVLRESLHTLKHTNRESGWDNAVTAMLEVLETNGTIDRASVELSVVKYLCSVLALICERLRRSCWSVSAGVGVV